MTSVTLGKLSQHPCWGTGGEQDPAQIPSFQTLLQKTRDSRPRPRPPTPSPWHPMPMSPTGQLLLPGVYEGHCRALGTGRRGGCCPWEARGLLGSTPGDHAPATSLTFGARYFSGMRPSCALQEVKQPLWSLPSWPIVVTTKNVSGHCQIVPRRGYSHPQRELLGSPKQVSLEPWSRSSGRPGLPPDGSAPGSVGQWPWGRTGMFGTIPGDGKCSSPPPRMPSSCPQHLVQVGSASPGWAWAWP